jgi:hypothetical protein
MFRCLFFKIIWVTGLIFLLGLPATANNELIGPSGNDQSAAENGQSGTKPKSYGRAYTIYVSMKDLLGGKECRLTSDMRECVAKDSQGKYNFSHIYKAAQANARILAVTFAPATVKRLVEVSRYWDVVGGDWGHANLNYLVLSNSSLVHPGMEALNVPSADDLKRTIAPPGEGVMSSFKEMYEFENLPANGLNVHVWEPIVVGKNYVQIVASDTIPKCPATVGKINELLKYVRQMEPAILKSIQASTPSAKFTGKEVWLSWSCMPMYHSEGPPEGQKYPCGYSAKVEIAYELTCNP